jgi:hypothetical protein
MNHTTARLHNWLWTALFSSVFAGSATDIFYNRDDIELRWENLNPSNRVRPLSRVRYVRSDVVALAVSERMKFQTRPNALVGDNDKAVYFDVS